ncbi:MAG: hypothetical protein QOI64_1880 [Solirubrobacteraceae bacterium]|jgi:hypothetical protein|nr:hypothetical protein [Solirubrobacteraceae bacterium]
MRRRAFAFAGLAVAVAAGVVALSTGAATRPAPAVVACEGARALEFECFERRYVGLVRSRGAAPALRDLARQRTRNGYVRAACHQLTHRAGRAAGAIDGIRAFEDGDPMCSSGYYHGVVEAVMERIGPAHVIDRAASVCARLRERERHSADHYNCAHGMGHGFMGSFSSDVFASLRGCDALADGWERHQCYGGVFMENLSAIGHATRPPTALRPHEPLYPCTAVAPRYREPCFDKQTTYALYVTDSDFAEVFALCSRVERAFRGACYRGLGGDIAVDAAKHLFDARARAISRRRLCLLGPDREARRACVVGVVRVILRDLAGGAVQTAAFCRALGGGDLRRVCIRARDEAYRTLPLR